MTKKLENKYDFAIIFDVKNGNPNGDPDNDNTPRIDIETGHGYTTDVFIKRRIRDYIQLTQGNKNTHDIFIKNRAVINNMLNEIQSEEIQAIKNKHERMDAARDALCDKYYDVRTFGAVLSTNKDNPENKATNVTGPVQITFCDSIDPINVDTSNTITRVCYTTQKKADGEGESEIGVKHNIPYAAYIGYGFISSPLANKTGFNIDDLNLLFESLKNMFENTRTASKGMMTMRKIVVFKHKSQFGNVPSAELFEQIEIKKNKEIIRNWQDYDFNVENKYDNVEIKVI